MAILNIADPHLVISAVHNAERSALRLFSISCTIYLENNSDLIRHFIAEAIETGINLGLNARKVIELCHLTDVVINQTRWKYDQSSPIETSSRNATNRFVHATHLKVKTLKSPTNIFGDDIIMTEFVIGTDKQPVSYIDICGFAWAYLSGVAPQILPNI